MRDRTKNLYYTSTVFFCTLHSVTRAPLKQSEKPVTSYRKGTSHVRTICFLCDAVTQTVFFALQIILIPLEQLNEPTKPTEYGADNRLQVNLEQL